jgi:TRAP-type uncharacterized transport system substrate-binding protein
MLINPNLMARHPAIPLLLCLVGWGALPAMAEEQGEDMPTGVVLMSGVEGGGYWSAGTRLQAVAEQELDLAVINLPSSGSMENLEFLLDRDSPVNLAFAQADAAQHYLSRHPEDLIKLDVLENIGQECVFIVTGIDSEIRTDEDLRDASDVRLGIASASSGMAVTFDYMVSQIPELADIKVTYGDTAAIMDELNSPDASVDAVMMVHRPREHSAEVDHALANASRYRFVELSDERFTEDLWNGRKVYRTMKLALPGADKPVKTICVSGLLLANKQKLSIRQRNQLGDLVSYHWMQVYATQ